MLTPIEKELLKNLKLDPEVEELAKNPTITDFWGFQHNWTNAEEGWYPFRRYQFLENLESIKKQRKTVKKFTKLGYQVMKIPKFLYETLLDQRNEKSLHVEECKVVLVLQQRAKQTTHLPPYEVKLREHDAYKTTTTPKLN